MWMLRNGMSHAWLVALLAILLVGCSDDEVVDEQGGAPTTVLTGAPTSVIFAADDQALFWAGDGITRTDLEGDGATEIGGNIVCALAVDGERVFFVDNDGVSSLTRAGAQDTTYHDNDAPPLHRALCTLAIDSTQLYALLKGPPRQLLVATKGTAGGAITSVPDGTGNLMAAAGTLYFTVNDVLWRLDEGATNWIELAVIGDNAQGLALGGAYAYWIRQPNPSSDAVIIQRVSIDGGAAQTIYEGAGAGCGNASSIVVDGSHVYFGVNFSREDVGGGGCLPEDVNGIAKVPLAGGDRGIVSSRASIGPIHRLASTTERIYFSVCSGSSCSILHVFK